MWVPGIDRLDGKPSYNMHGWLTTENFAPTITDGIIELQGVDPKILLQAFAGDLNRVALAGSESLNNIVNIPTIPKSLGWPYVKLYYSAFFYAHAILRAWGRSPSYLRTSDLIRVKQVFQLYTLSPPFKLQTGQYLLSAGSNADSLFIAPMNSGGGTHEAIWRIFQTELSDLQSRVIAAPYTSSDKGAISGALNSAVNLLTNHGANTAWPSAMRNDIQYRQTEGLWFPYTGRKKTVDFARHVTDILCDTKKTEDVLACQNDNLSRFQAACSFVVVLARQMLSDLSQVGGAKSFLKFGQSDFERSLTTNT